MSEVRFLDTPTTLADAFGLPGQTAVVTGAASGLGRGIAQALARAGARVLCTDTDEDGADGTAADLRQEGHAASATALDVSSRESVFATIAAFSTEWGRLDVVCNAAGITHDGTVPETSEADLDRLIAVNLKGTYFGCQAAATVMVPQKRGVIINLASTAIDRPLPGKSVYGITKVGVTHLTKVLAHELGPHGIRVNAIAPGFVLTGMSSRAFIRPDGSIDEVAKRETITRAGARGPLGKLVEPEDVGWAAVYLASNAGRTVTGQILRPNCGATMPW